MPHNATPLRAYVRCVGLHAYTLFYYVPTLHIRNEIRENSAGACTFCSKNLHSILRQYSKYCTDKHARTRAHTRGKTAGPCSRACMCALAAFQRRLYTQAHQAAISYNTCCIGALWWIGAHGRHTAVYISELVIMDKTRDICATSIR